VCVDGPLGECGVTVAELGERNVQLSCRVRSKPAPTTLFWLIDEQHGTTVSDDGQIIDDYWTLVQVGYYSDDTWRIQQ